MRCGPRRSRHGEGDRRWSAEPPGRAGTQSRRWQIGDAIIERSGRVLERLPDVCVLQLGVLLTKLLAIGIRRQRFEHAAHGDSKPANTGLPVQLFRIDGDPVEARHSRRIADRQLARASHMPCRSTQRPAREWREWGPSTSHRSRGTGASSLAASDHPRRSGDEFVPFCRGALRVLGVKIEQNSVLDDLANWPYSTDLG